jgi:hypothetical protein
MYEIAVLGELTHSLGLLHMHSPQFLNDLKKVFRDNTHLSPFFVNIRAYADDLSDPNIIVIRKGENLFLSGSAECGSYDGSLKTFVQSCFAEGETTLWLNVPSIEMENKITGLFREYKPQTAIRYNFRLNIDAFNKLPAWQAQLPAGFSIEYYDP